jgi:hypothetical protein
MFTLKNYGALTIIIIIIIRIPGIKNTNLRCVVGNWILFFIEWPTQCGKQLSNFSL